MRMEEEWWQGETELKPEDIVDSIKTDSKVDEWRKQLIEQLLEDRLVAALKEKSERVAALQVTGMVEKGVRWDAALQRDVLQRVRREIRKSLVFQRFREELKAKLSTSPWREDLKQLCARCLKNKENLSIVETGNHCYENDIISNSKEEPVDKEMFSSEMIDVENCVETIPKTETLMKLEEMDSNQLESEDTNRTNCVEQSLQTMDSESEKWNAKVELPPSIEPVHLAETRIEERADLELSHSSEEKQHVRSKLSRGSKSTQRKDVKFVDQGAIAQALGNKMNGRKVKLLRFTEKGQMKWLSAQVLEYEEESQQHKVRTEEGEEDWILFSKENVLLLK